MCGAGLRLVADMAGIDEDETVKSEVLHYPCSKSYIPLVKGAYKYYIDIGHGVITAPL
jgi:hypothetical protein